MRPARKNTPLRDLQTCSGSRAPRLFDCAYRGEIDVHLTLCADRGRPFENAGVAKMVCGNVEFYCKKLAYRLYGYTLMPDHLHVLLSPAESRKPLAYWLDVFKSYTTNRFVKASGHPPFWQRSAHDHVCRSGETAEAVLAYIANNPARVGLVDDWRDWRWTRVFIKV